MRSDTITGGAFLALGIAFVASGLALPPGVGGLPGAGFFPQVIGAVMALLACGLLLQCRGEERRAPSGIGNVKQVAGTAALLLGYLSLWGTGFFAVRTAVFLAVTLRFLGQKWAACWGFAAVLTVVIYLTFNTGLNITLE